MKGKLNRLVLIFLLVGTGLFQYDAIGCSMILVGKKASADGSVLLAHNNDLPGHIGSLIEIVLARAHKPGEMIEFKNGLKIPQAGHTYRMLIMYCYYGFAEGDAVAINQHGVAIAGGVALKGDRNEQAERLDPLVKQGVSGYVRYIAMQRARTARECVEIIGNIYSKYGISYPSGVGVADANEVWYLEVGGGKCWVAQRVPDDSYMAIANGYRIGEIDFEDKKNFIYPDYLKKYVIKKGLWKPGNKRNKEEKLNFAKVFGGKKEKEKNYYNARRVWRMQGLLTPSLKQAPALFSHRLILKPDEPVTVSGLIAILREYYSGTPFDVTQSGNENERAIGVFNTVHTDVIQLRGDMPPDIGAVMWAGLSSSLTTPYIPYYLGIEEIPEAYTITGPEYEENSAFWRFRTLATLLELNFGEFIKKLLPVWQYSEKVLFSLQPVIEKTALDLYKTDREQARTFLTIYSNGLALKALEKAKFLEKQLKTELAKKSNKRRHNVI